VSKAKAKGTTAEREVVRYLQNWWPAAERRALSGNKDKGDVAGVNSVCIEIKAAKTQLIGPWQRETLTEMKNARVGMCLLVVKRPYKPVSKWDAYMPISQMDIESEYLPPGGAYEWVRMDLMLAALQLRILGY
jgi:Holliday junction resolvase